MKKLLVAAGVSAMLIASQAVAFADGAESEDAPRVVDRLSAAVVSPDEVLVPVKPGTAAPVLATGTYNNLISQATVSSNTQKYMDFFRCYPFGCENFSFPNYSGLLFTGGIVTAVVVAANDDSESD